MGPNLNSYELFNRKERIEHIEERRGPRRADTLQCEVGATKNCCNSIELSVGCRQLNH